MRSVPRNQRSPIRFPSQPSRARSARVSSGAGVPTRPARGLASFSGVSRPRRPARPEGLRVEGQATLHSRIGFVRGSQSRHGNRKLLSSNNLRETPLALFAFFPPHQVPSGLRIEFPGPNLVPWRLARWHPGRGLPDLRPIPLLCHLNSGELGSFATTSLSFVYLQPLISEGVRAIPIGFVRRRFLSPVPSRPTEHACWARVS